MFLKLFNSKILHNFKSWLLLVVVYYFFSSATYALAAIVKHSHYETFVDLAVFNQGIWQYSHLKFPFITLHLDRYFLGDHFHPILILFTPFYWVLSSEKTLLFLQPFVLLSAIIPLFLIGCRLTKSYFFSFCIIFAYSLYIPLQYTLFYDFHEIIFLPPLFAWAYYFYTKSNKKLSFIFLFLCLFVKEEVGFFIAIFGLYIFIMDKSWRKFGLLWMVLGTLYSILMMHIVIPKIGGSYLYFDYGDSGKTPIDVVINFFKNPISFFKLFFTPSVKIETLYKTFWPYGFLPLLSPLGLLLSFEQFFSRFIDLKTTTRWTIGYHYSAIMSVVVAISTIWSAFFYTRFIKQKKLALIVLGILLLSLTRLEQINASAILLIKTPTFWQRSNWMDDLDQAIKLLPSDASVATQNNITPHVSSRKFVYLLADMEKADYILADFHPGQSDYNFYGSENKVIYQEKLRDKILSGKYEVKYQNQEVILIKRI